jgi:hypothetical protein
MTPHDPIRSIPVNIGGKEYDLILYPLPDPPATVTRWRLQVIHRSLTGHLQVIRAWLYAHAMPLMFAAGGLLLAAALVAAAVTQ